MSKPPMVRRRCKAIGKGYDILDADALLDEQVDGEMFTASLADALSRNGWLGFRKHEREALRAIREIAERHAVAVNVVRRGHGPLKAVLAGAGGRKVVSIPMSPADPHWSVVVTRRQAEAACCAVGIQGKRHDARNL